MQKAAPECFWAHGMAEHLSIGHQGTVQPAPPFVSQILSDPPGHKVCTEEIYHNLGPRPLSKIKLWVTPPGKPPKPAEMLAEEEEALQRVEEKGGGG